MYSRAKESYRKEMEVTRIDTEAQYIRFVALNAEIKAEVKKESQ